MDRLGKGSTRTHVVYSAESWRSRAMDLELESRLKGKAGVRFFGDIHGCAAEFAALADEAVAHNLHLHSLGDLINRGPDSPGCMRLACDLHDSGWLDINPGNHDALFCRWHLWQ